MSTGLSPGLSTKWANLPEDLDDEVIHSAGLARIKTITCPSRLWGRLWPFAWVYRPLICSRLRFGLLNGAFWRKPDLEQLCYGDPAGDGRLRGLIAAYLRSSRGMQCTAEQIVITSGAQQAISLCAQLLVEPGDGVAVENPGYRAAGHAFALAGGRLHGVPVDGEGMDCQVLGTLNDCRVAYVTPSHQYPLGW